MALPTNVRLEIRNNLYTYLQANAPIKNADAKVGLAKQLGYTVDQFGKTSSNINEWEVTVGNEFFRLKKMGLVEQTGWLWIMPNQSSVATQPQQTQPEPIDVAETQSEPVDVAETQPEPTVVVETQPEPTVVAETQPEPIVVVDNPEPMGVVETQPEPIVVAEPQEVLVETQIEPTVVVANPEPIVVAEIQPELVVVAEPQEVLVDIAKPEIALFECTGYLNSLIESTACYGNYDKASCDGCLIAYWCKPLTIQMQMEMQATLEKEQAKKKARTSLARKYGKVAIDTIMQSLKTNDAKLVQCVSPQSCALNGVSQIALNDSCFHIPHFGIVSTQSYSELSVLMG
jgi:hypothetical protein